jgi:phage-related protein
MTKIIYYTTARGENPVKTFLESLQKPQKAKFFRIFQYIEFYGLSSILPHVKKLTGTPFWEIRILGKDNLRIIYISIQDNNVLLLHGFAKKTQKTSPRDIGAAIMHYEDWVKRGITA